MAGGLVGGSALGSLFQELFKGVQDVATKTVMFKSSFKDLVSTLNQIDPLIEEIERYDKLLDRKRNELDFQNQLEKGLKLVQKCSKIKWGKLNCFLMSYYASKIEGFDNSLLKSFQIYGQLRNSIDSGKTLLSIGRLDSKINQLGTTGEMFGWSGGSCGVPGAPEFVVGLEEPLEQLKRKLIDGKERVLVVTAPGGCGKTTLVKKICRDEDIKDRYQENIFFVTFSQKPNIEVIINNMFQHKDFFTPVTHTEEELFNQLELMLREIRSSNPVLLVFDDVWSGSESCIEKFQFNIPDYKILVTSRYKFKRFASYELKLLKDQDAMELFLHSAFPQGDSSRISTDIVNKIVRACGGFPLALEVVGASLRGQDTIMWKHMLKEWSKGKSIFSSHIDLLKCLQSTIDTLAGITKECFLDLASFPEDQKTPVTTLIDMWAELYDLEDDGDEAMFNLYTLSDRNLVNLVLPSKDASENEECYDEHFVAQHDILRELGIHDSKQNQIERRKRLVLDIKGNELPKWWIEQRKHPVCAQLVSISADGRITNWPDLELPKVKVLVLNIRAENDILPQFITTINHLKALIITNNDLCSAEIINFSLLGHLQNLKRIILKHIAIRSIDNSILKLKNLRKLSLIMCKIDEAFQACDVKIPDMPNLVEILIDYCSDLVELPAWLCNISSLEKISIMNCHDLIRLSEEFGKLENLKTFRLSCCTNLEELPEAIGNLQKLQFLDLSDCIKITTLPESIGELSDLKMLNVRGCGDLSELPVSIKKLKNLESVICDNETSYLWEEFKVYLPNLNVYVAKEVPNLDWLHC